MKTPVSEEANVSAANVKGASPAVTKYRYSGPLSGVTLDNGSEVMLHPGAEVDLPEGHEHTKTLQALGHLTPVLQPKSTKGKGTNDGR